MNPSAIAAGVGSFPRLHLAAVELADDAVHQADLGDDEVPDLAGPPDGQENTILIGLDREFVVG